MNCMKKKIIFIVLLVLSLAISNSVWAAPELNLSTVSGQSGDTVNVTASFVSDSSVTSMQFDILYDQTQLSSGIPLPGAALGANGLAYSEPSAGLRRIVITPSSNNDVSSTGDLITLPFTIDASADQNDKLLILNNVIMSDALANAVTPTSETNGVIQILDITAPITTATPASGTYTVAQSVTLSSNEVATIYYTTDGSIPTTSSAVYSNPIAVSVNTALKFMAVDASGNVERDKSEVYVFDAQLQTIFDLSARAKDSIVGISWTPVPSASAYNVFRSTVQGGPYTLIAAGHVTTYAVYADSGLTNGVLYYYVVTSLINGVESLNSNEAIGRPRTRSR